MHIAERSKGNSPDSFAFNSGMKLIFAIDVIIVRILVDVDSIYITSPGPDAGRKID